LREREREKLKRGRKSKRGKKRKRETNRIESKEDHKNEKRRRKLMDRKLK